MAIVGREIQALRDDATRQQFTNSDWNYCTLQYTTEHMTNATQDVHTDVSQIDSQLLPLREGLKSDYTTIARVYTGLNAFCITIFVTQQGFLLIPKIEFFINADIRGWNFL